MLRFTTILLAILVFAGPGPDRAFGQNELVAAQTSRAPGDARGFVMRLDGMVVGRVATVDPSTFNLVPLRGAMVMFAQNRRVIAQMH